MSQGYRPERFEIRVDARLLLIDGKRAALGARAFDLLQALYERRDRIVTKNELLDLVWPGVVVEENNLQVQVSTLRKLLGSQSIVTIPGRGYRFIASAESGASSRGDSPSAAPSPTASPLPAAAPVSPPADRPLDSPGNLPDVVSQLYGRDDDLRGLQALLQDTRLVTIAGAGGIGKTHLAQALAQASRGDWPDGVWMIDLASTIDPGLVPGAVAHAMRLSLPGQRPLADELLDALRPLRALLVLDNCEHLLEACGELVHAALARASAVSIVTTSQEPLHLQEERIYRLNTLALPASPDDEDARHGGAVALFEARAASADPRFKMGPGDIGRIVDICRRLDGLPLAIELAAARVPVLGVEGVRSRLDASFRLLTGGARFALRRHQTVHAALDWSYQLLIAAEQSVFRSLGVFTGGFAMTSAQYVAKTDGCDEWDVLDHLGVLVDKSLVQVDMSTEPRYRLLETSRAFALEKLREAGETEGALRRHAEAILALFQAAEGDRRSLPSQTLRDRYLPDLGNVRAALDWAANVDGGGELLIALTAACGWVWVPGGARLEGLRRHAVAMARVDATTPPTLEAPLLLAFSASVSPARLRSEIPLLGRAATLYRELGDRRGLYAALLRRSGIVETDEGERDVAEAASVMDAEWPLLARRSLMIARAALLYRTGRFDECWDVRQQLLNLDKSLGDPRLLMSSLANLADLAFARDDIEQALSFGHEALALLRREWPRLRGEPNFVLANLGAVLTRAGILDEALDLSREGCQQMRASGVFVHFLEHYALLAFKRGRIADAARCVGHVVAFHRRENVTGQFTERRALAEVTAALRETLPGHELERLFREGELLTAEEAAHDALHGELDRAPDGAPAGA